MADKNKKDFMNLSTIENKVFGLIELTKKTTGKFPSIDELEKGLKTLNIELTDELKEKIEKTFNVKF